MAIQDDDAWKEEAFESGYGGTVFDRGEDKEEKTHLTRAQKARIRAVQKDKRKAKKAA